MAVQGGLAEAVRNMDVRDPKTGEHMGLVDYLRRLFEVEFTYEKHRKFVQTMMDENR